MSKLRTVIPICSNICSISDSFHSECAHRNICWNVPLWAQVNSGSISPFKDFECVACGQLHQLTDLPGIISDDIPCDCFQILFSRFDARALSEAGRFSFSVKNALVAPIPARAASLSSVSSTFQTLRAYFAKRATSVL